MALAASTPIVANTPAACPRVRPSEMTRSAEGPGLKQRKNSVMQKNAQVSNFMPMISLCFYGLSIVRKAYLDIATYCDVELSNRRAADKQRAPSPANGAFENLNLRIPGKLAV